MESTLKSNEEAAQINELNSRVESLNIESKDAKTSNDKEVEDQEVRKDNEPSTTIPPSNTVNSNTQQAQNEEYLVKNIDWNNKKIKILTQNVNGPCPLVAICNVLFLRGDLEIRPPDREVVTFEYLVDRLGDYLLSHGPAEEEIPKAAPSAPPKLEKRQETSEFVLTYRHNLDTALSILPNLKSGLDVNVKFDSIRGFEPTAELAMFDLFNVDLVHGWVADPQDVETYDVVVKKCGTYNHLVESIVQADELNSPPSGGDGSMAKNLTLDEEEKLHQGFIATEFLKDTATQLTYFGLDLLLDSIPVNTLCVLFRNNHFSTVFRHSSAGLYMLVTDSGLVSEHSIVWESLGDVDQSSSEFFNSEFKRSTTIQGTDVIIPEENPDVDLDYAIAVSIQNEQQRQQRNSYHSNTNSNPTTPNKPASNRFSHSKKKSDGNKCIIS